MTAAVVEDNDVTFSSWCVSEVAMMSIYVYVIGKYDYSAAGT